MIQVFLLALLFNVATAFSIVLTGDRALISGNLLKNFWGILFSWKFILAMVLAILSRFLFIIINNQLLKIPTLAPSSTTITVFITATSYIFIVATNLLILHERISGLQYLGIGLILVGVVVLSLR
jgi:drug/metabolite transporter (DMT)-like permease